MPGDCYMGLLLAGTQQCAAYSTESGLQWKSCRHTWASRPASDRPPFSQGLGAGMQRTCRTWCHAM